MTNENWRNEGVIVTPHLNDLKLVKKTIIKHGSYNWIITLENAGAQISLFIASYEYLGPMAIEKNQNPGGPVGLELPAKQ